MIPPVKNTSQKRVRTRPHWLTCWDQTSFPPQCHNPCHILVKSVNFDTKNINSNPGIVANLPTILFPPGRSASACALRYRGSSLYYGLGRGAVCKKIDIWKLSPINWLELPNWNNSIICRCPAVFEIVLGILVDIRSTNELTFGGPALLWWTEEICNVQKDLIMISQGVAAWNTTGKINKWHTWEPWEFKSLNMLNCVEL